MHLLKCNNVLALGVCLLKMKCVHLVCLFAESVRCGHLVSVFAENVMR